MIVSNPVVTCVQGLCLQLFSVQECVRFSVATTAYVCVRMCLFSILSLYICMLVSVVSGNVHIYFSVVSMACVCP